MALACKKRHNLCMNRASLDREVVQSSEMLSRNIHVNVVGHGSYNAELNYSEQEN